MTDILKNAVLSALVMANILKDTDAINRVKELSGSDVSRVYLLEASTKLPILCQDQAPLMNRCMPMLLWQRCTMPIWRVWSSSFDATKTIRVPKPYCTGLLEDNKGAFSVMEYIEFGSNAYNPDVQYKLGKQLAEMHEVKGPKEFGVQKSTTL